MRERPMHFKIRTFAAGALLALVLGPAGTAAQQPASADPSGPRLRVDEMQVDLGTLIKGDRSVAEFALHNDGDETLRIVKVKPG